MINMTSNESLKDVFQKAARREGVALSFHAYFPQRKLDLWRKRIIYFDEERLVRLRDGLAVGIFSGQLRVGEINYNKLSTEFQKRIAFDIHWLDYENSIPVSDAKKIAIATCGRNVFWDEGLTLLKSVYGASKDDIHINSFEDALFTVFLRIGRPPEDISFWGRVFSFPERKERMRSALQNDKDLFNAYMESAIRCCEERMGCSDSDLEKIYSECVAEKKKGRKLD